MNTKKINTFKNWMTENVEPCNFSNKKYKNYLAIVKMDDDGNEVKTFMEISDGKFNISPIQINDILVASCWDIYKRRQRKHYYIVVEKTADYITLAYASDDTEFTTYLKTVKYIIK